MRLPAPGRCVVLGVLNVTPDSFSDGGQWLDTTAAIQRGLELREQGADLVDVGGESTRPGAGRVEPAEELRRVLPVVRELVGAGVPVSIDTTRAEVAGAALGCGARLVNDVSGGRADPALLRVVAEADAPVVLMHWRGPAATMQQRAEYRDVVTEVVAETGRAIDSALAAGVDPARVVIDPGLGFAKRPEHNWALLARLDAMIGTGHPVLVGASRKSFLGELLAANGDPRPAAQRDAATTAVTALAAAAGAWGVRVHDVAASADAVRVVARWRNG